MSVSTILSMKNITKAFPGVVALNDVSFDVRKGTVHAIVGENGAGKSTLMKILSGVYHPESGEIWIEGEKVAIRNPVDAEALGISIIYQEFNLVPSLSVAENVFLGRLSPRIGGRVRWKELRARAQALVDELGVAIDVRRKVSSLSVAEMQMVEIAKSLSFEARILIMDEPSATLTQAELDRLFTIVKKLRDEGVTSIYISHRLEEVFSICDFVTVLRDGQVVGTAPTVDTNKDAIVHMMVGRTIDAEFPARVDHGGAEAMRVEDLRVGKALGPVSFSVSPGRSSALPGSSVPGGPSSCVDFSALIPRLPGRHSFRAGKSRSDPPTMRSTAGSACSRRTARSKGSSSITPSCATSPWRTFPASARDHYFLDSNREKSVSEEYCRILNVKTPSMAQSVVYLSGGNQQKVVLAKWLFANTRIVIMDEPTRGIDVGAKYEIYVLIQGLVSEGKSVVLISSELNEVLSLSAIGYSW